MNTASADGDDAVVDDKVSLDYAKHDWHNRCVTQQSNNGGSGGDGGNGDADTKEMMAVAMTLKP